MQTTIDASAITYELSWDDIQSIDMFPNTSFGPSYWYPFAQAGTLYIQVYPWQRREALSPWCMHMLFKGTCFHL